MAERPSDGRLLAALLVVQVAFGGLAVAAKILFRSHDMQPLALSLCRLVAGGILLFALERVLVRSRFPPLRDLAMFAGFALLGVTLNQGLYLAGVSLTSATEAILLIATIPAFTLLVAVALRKETTTPLKVGGLALSFAGIVVLVSAHGFTFTSQAFLGDLMVLANSLSYSIYLVVSRKALEKYDALTLISWVFVLGALEMSIVALPQLLATDWGGFDSTSWLAFAYVIVFGSVVTYGLNTWVLRHSTASHVASFVYLQPIVGAFAAWWILKEPLGWRVFAAGALILAGVALANKAGLRRRAANPTE